MKKILYGVIFIALTALMFSPSQAMGQFFYLENEDIGKEVKDFTLKIANGEKVSLKEFSDGKKTIVFFWATWCPHCRAQLKELNANKEEIAKKNIKLALVNVGEKEELVNKYAEKNKINLDIFLDEKSEVSDAYGLVGLPTFYFVNEKGIVMDVQHGFPEDLEKVFSAS